MSFRGIDDGYYVGGASVKPQDLKAFSDKNKITVPDCRRVSHFCQTVTVSQEYNDQCKKRGGMCAGLALQHIFAKVRGETYFPGTQEDIYFYDNFLVQEIPPGFSNYKNTATAFAPILAPAENLTIGHSEDIPTANLGNQIGNYFHEIGADFLLICLNAKRDGKIGSDAHFITLNKKVTANRVEYEMYDCNIGEYVAKNLSAAINWCNTLTNWDKRPKFDEGGFKSSYAKVVPYSIIMHIKKNSSNAARKKTTKSLSVQYY